MTVSLASDLKAVRGWIERETVCVIQRTEGWYKKDCIESKAKRKCTRCKILARLDRQIAQT